MAPAAPTPASAEPALQPAAPPSVTIGARTSSSSSSVDDADAATDVTTSESDAPAAPVMKLHDYIIGKRVRSGVKTLHLMGACWRQPGRDYLVGEICGNSLPDPSKYTQICRNCFHRTLGSKLAISGEETPTTGASSE